MSTDQRARFYTSVLGVAVVLVLAATLIPAGSNKPLGSHLCLLCGARGGADAIRNTILFIPIGVTALLWSRRVFKALLLAVLLSASVEIAQLLIPGRHATLGDLLFNSLGAGIGIGAISGVGFWLRPAPRVARLFALGATALALLTIVLTGYLLQPQFPQSTYFGQRTPDLGHLEWYRGRVLEFTIGSETIAGGRRVVDSGETRGRLEVGATLRTVALAGPRTERLSSLVSIYDDQHREVVLLGPDRDDLVYRYRTRSISWRLDQPDLRLRGALAGVSSGDTLWAAVARDGDRYCVTVNQVRSCNLGFTAGDGWSLIYHSDRVPNWLGGILAVIWLGALALPGAFWAPGRGLAALNSAFLFSGLALIPMVTHFLPTPPVEFVALGLGILAGLYLRSCVDSAARGGAGT
jgi:hypothetical protein